MSELYDKIVSQRGTLENIIASIPGFKGYQERAARHTADTMLREHIAAQIANVVDEMVRVEKIILDNGGLSYMSKTRDVKGQIQLFHDKVATAMPGYAGMWAQVKIGPDEMEALYTFDEAQLRYVDQISGAVDSLKAAALNDEGVNEAINALREIVAEAIDAYELRKDMITGLGQSL